MGWVKGLAALRGETTDTAVGLTWVADTALRVLTWQDDSVPVGELLCAVAEEVDLDIAVVPASAPWALDALACLTAADVAVLWAVDGVLGRLARDRGWSEVLKQSASAPGELAAPIAEALHEALSEARAGVSAGAHALLVADELAGEAGWLVSPDFALEVLVPCYRRLAAVGAWPVVFHSDGDIRAIYKALADASFCAVHIAADSWQSTEALFGAARSNGLVPMGGLPARALMSEGARATGSHAMRLAASAGAVICDDGGMTTAEELAAYVSAVEAMRKLEDHG